MPEDRRAILRKMQDQRKESLSVVSDEYERQQRQKQQQQFDGRASLRQFNASDYQEEDYDNDPRYPDDRDRTDTLKLVLYDLNSAIAPREIRLLAIRSAIDEFDHDEELLHDEELDLRADHILLQKLCYAMAIDPRGEEVGYICAAMEMVYRAGKKRLAKSFHEICDALLPMFVEMIKRPPYVERIEEEVVEEKEEIIVSEEEEEEEDYGIEQNMEFDPYAPNVHMGDEDDESAESVSIPAGTGEYFDHMEKMASMGTNSAAEAQEASNDLVPQPVNLSNAGGIEPYNPANDQQQQPSQSQSQDQQYTPEQLYALAEQISKMQAQQAAQQQMTPGTGAQPSHSTDPTDAAAGQLVPVQPNSAISHYAGQLNQYAPDASNMPYTGQQMIPMHQGQGTQPVNNNMAYGTQPYQAGPPVPQAPPQGPVPPVTQPYQTQSPPAQNMTTQQPYYAGQPMPHVPPQDQSLMVAPSAGQMAYQSAEMPRQTGQLPFVPNQPQEVMTAAQQLTNLTVGDGTQTDDEALRLRGGGEGDSNQGDYDSQGVTDHFDQLYEGANNNFPSADSYHEYMDETGDISVDASGENPRIEIDPFLDSSDITGDSESIKKLDARLRANSKSSGSDPMFGADQEGFRGNAPRDAPNMPPIYDTDGNFADNYPTYINDQADDGYNLQSEQNAEANFHKDYSEYLNDDGGQLNHPVAEHGYDDNDNADHDSNPFAHKNEHGADDASNPFVETSGRVGHQDGSQQSKGSSRRAKGPFAGDSSNPIRPEDPSIPTHVGDDQESVSASLRSGLTNDFTIDTVSRKTDRRMESNPFDGAGVPTQVDNLNAVEEHPNEDYGGNSSYNDGYENNEYTDKGHHPHSQDWAETSESSQSHGVYDVPTFNAEDEMYPRRDSELTGDSHYDESRFEFEESRGGASTLHVVEEENDDYQEEMDYADQPEDSMAYNGYNQDEYDDDIFQFQEPTMAKPMAAESFSTRYVEKATFCPLAVRKVLKILRYFSRVLSAMEQLAQQPGLVDALLYQMTRNPHTCDDEDEIAARIDAIACVVNLACAEENKIMLVYHPGLLDAVIDIANHDPIEEAREHAAIVMMNLAYAEENKVHMVNQDNLLDTLVYLLSDVSPFTRRYASAALFTLACTYANTAVMARHCDGGILEALRKVLLNDPVDEARVNAAEALFNMARNNSDDTVENMGNHPKLLASLAHSVLTDYSADVRAYSARALEWLSADIHYPMKCHPRLLQALTTASQWTKTTCIAEALKMQASLSDNRRSMVEHPGLLDALAQLSLLEGINDDEVKSCAIAAMERLSKEPSTRHLMARNEGVMTALTRATFADDGYDDDEDAPQSTLMKMALKNLAEHL